MITLKRWRLWLVVAGLLVFLHLLQSQVMQKTEVQRLERESQDLGELSASQLPTYIGTLFLGSFRAVAIDILWIQMARMREQEHRYFETVELMELITRFQPRNPEAWSYMAWDACGNIASQFRTEEDFESLRALDLQIKAGGANVPELEARKRKLEEAIRRKDKSYRTWVKLGLTKLSEACRHMPDDPYLRYEVGGTLWTKSAWSAGILDRQFMSAVEDDDDLQRILGQGLEPGPRRTAFELAVPWFESGKATLEKLIRERRFRVFQTLAEAMSRPREEERRHHTTQIGRNIDVAAFVGAIVQQEYLGGVLKWYRALEDPAAAPRLLSEASESFRRAAGQAVLFRREHSPVQPGARTLHDARAELFQALADLCADQAKLTHPLAEKDRAALLSRIEGFWWSPVDRDQQILPADDRYVSNYMGTLKRSLGGDAWEYNDDRKVLDREDLITAGEVADATIAPDLDDIDWYHFYAAAPRRDHHGHDHGEEPAPAPGPITARFEITRFGDLPLNVTTFAFHQGKVVEKAVTTPEFEISTDLEGAMYIRVTAASKSGDPAQSGYRIKALGIQR
jgi:hypothetical protein